MTKSRARTLGARRAAGCEASGVGRVAGLCVAAVTATLAPSVAMAGSCDADIDGSGQVDGGDLGIALGSWGPCGGCSADLDGSGVVDGADLGLLLGEWGPCVAVITPPWAELIEAAPDPALVTDEALRDAISATGYAWRVRDMASQVEMLLVPPGSFDMGCSPSDLFGCLAAESPVHSVELTKAYYLGRFEVTQSQWSVTMGSNPSLFQGEDYPDAASRPVERVSWLMIQGFLAATGLRLPTEAEWEYACRAGTATAFHSLPAFPEGTNDDELVGAIGWYYYNAGEFPFLETQPVGTRASNALGLHDMSGNVWEWAGDWYSATYYQTSPTVDPPGPATGSLRVLRGGSFLNESDALRSSRRGGSVPSRADYYYGFRVARFP